jgi:NadR type nicotinamide-nucleotide adenylyltransferase
MINKVAIIGPECTGKTTLASQLANHFSTIWIPEYARNYIENLNHKYTFADVEQIAKYQYLQISAKYSGANKFVFFDTDLIITKVWFEVVFDKLPGWIDDVIKNNNFSTYLLCDTSLPWIPDNVRENGGEMRDILYNKYREYLDYYGFKYFVVSGLGNDRLKNAIDCLNLK